MTLTTETTGAPGTAPAGAPATLGVHRSRHRGRRDDDRWGRWADDGEQESAIRVA